MTWLIQIFVIIFHEMCPISTLPCWDNRCRSSFVATAETPSAAPQTCNERVCSHLVSFSFLFSFFSLFSVYFTCLCLYDISNWRTLWCFYRSIPIWTRRTNRVSGHRVAKTQQKYQLLPIYFSLGMVHVLFTHIYTHTHTISLNSPIINSIIILWHFCMNKQIK